MQGQKIIIFFSLSYISYNCIQFYAKFVTVCKKAQAGLHDIFWTCNQLFFWEEELVEKEWVE